jgi:hypothetical protein
MLAEAIVSLVALIAFAVLFYGPWQETCSDFARQLIFEQRNRLFDLAMAERMDFKSEEYRRIRRRLNGMIRFAHRLTWPRLVVLSLEGDEEHAAELTIADLIKPIEDPSTAAEVNDILHRSLMALIAMMALKSIFVAVPATFLILLAACTRGLNWLFMGGRMIDVLADKVDTGARHAEAA